MGLARDPRVLAALAVAREHGLPTADPRVVHERPLRLALRPASVVARVVRAQHPVRDPATWATRAIELAGWLHREGAPVIPPARTVPPGPHVRDGHVVTLWEFAAAGRARARGEDFARDAGAALRLCHEALQTYPGSLPLIDALTEAEALVAALAAQHALGHDAAEALQERLDAIRPPLAELRALLAPVHGDANLANVAQSSAGVAWSAWENACVGPRSWDAACLAAAGAPGAVSALAEQHDPGELALLVQARELQLAAWAALEARLDGHLHSQA